MDAIAVEAGVSKATVYKHWSGKDDLLMEVIQTMQVNAPDFESDDPRHDMSQMMGYMAHSKKREELGRIWPRVINYAVNNPEFGNALRKHSFTKRRQQIERILQRAVSKKQLRENLDPEMALDLLIGPLMRRRFLGDSVPEGWSEQVVDYFWQVFRPR